MARGIPTHPRVFGRPCKNCGGTERYGVSYSCVVCTNRRSQERKQTPKYRERVRRTTLKKRYGLSPEDVAAKLIAQRGRCAICGAREPGNANGWNIDHDHATGEVRGILCHGCNIGLGGFKDSIDRMQRAVRYLLRNGQGQRELLTRAPAPHLKQDAA